MVIVHVLLSSAESVGVGGGVGGGGGLVGVGEGVPTV